MPMLTLRGKSDISSNANAYSPLTLKGNLDASTVNVANTGVIYSREILNVL